MHSFAGTGLAGRLQLPSFSQHFVSEPGNMKNFGHEMHPPQMRVTTINKDNNELETAFITTVTSVYPVALLRSEVAEIGSVRRTHPAV